MAARRASGNCKPSFFNVGMRGGAQAITAVSGNDKQGIRAVVVESTFFSCRSIVRDKLAAIPLLSWFKAPLSHLLIGNDSSPADYVAPIAFVPILLIYGTADEVIPFQHGNLLLERQGAKGVLADRRRRAYRGF